jgi:hypothetical protein
MHIEAEEIAQRAKIPLPTLNDWRKRGVLVPANFRAGVAGRRPRYKRSDLLAAAVIRLLREQGVPLGIAALVGSDLQEHRLRHDRGTRGLVFCVSRVSGSAWRYERAPTADYVRQIEYLSALGQLGPIIWPRDVLDRAAALLR